MEEKRDPLAWLSVVMVTILMIIIGLALLLKI